MMQPERRQPSRAPSQSEPGAADVPASGAQPSPPDRKDAESQRGSTPEGHDQRSPAASDRGEGIVRLPFQKTLGGRQFWVDVYFFRDWRIQQNVFTRHYRLLDRDDYRHAWGSFEDCKRKLDEIRRKLRLPPMNGPGVILIHGILRSSKSMGRLRSALEKAGYLVFPFDYPSSQLRIEEAAEYLHRAIQSLEGVRPIHFVVHSMGGLVLRAYLMKHRDARIGRIVMLGVPNRGAVLADKLKGLALYRALFGPAGVQLAGGKDGLIARLPIPDVPFAIIAGARGTPEGYNPLVPGDDDGTVSVESTKLPGAADFATVKCLHSFLMSNPTVIDYVLRFLEEGRLRPDPADVHPIPRAAEAPTATPQAAPSPERPER